MPPKAKFTREEIVKTALAIVRKRGGAAVTARAVAEELGSSPKVIFGLFRNMDELREEMIKSADRTWNDFLKAEMEKDDYPPYKASGMAYIRFAKEEKELFKLLFMRDRSGNRESSCENDFESVTPILEILQNSLSIDADTAKMFHLEMWIFVHGIASITVTSYSDWDDEVISELLSVAYDGILRHYRDGK